ncbi:MULTISPECIES: serine protease [unclassified Streptomyces]|uniref:S1 family peptidase n=1 Tax=unclassified Streptomyces TaxID=2593676 RepID=UPI0008813690|nr:MULTISPECIES: serine protease [unclassified Streptomyces]PBC84779.1 V8-like Glu-specific endopeptidase [Streptomyces sp. 2321.6]SDR26751.1 V8-like Glu-specific endopeptidase [Streptomyces sp. KS_16]SED44218.1 V8-like Glu-specific endopeptidase [Streptomyces sp. 2133.1]SEE42467.1 V8-like Glu-specific endopeptidase [Streptomyces sp. 2112.3]SNC70802.1 V8-like Glu-specific endopeptidase [Streptomyces sp. 2114.4]
MNRPLVGTLATAVLGAAALAGTVGTAHAAPQHGAQQNAEQQHVKQQDSRAAKAKAVDFAGTVALSNCSGSVVRMPTSQSNDPALVMSNGHCLESGMPGAGEVIVDQPSSRSFTLLNKSAGRAGTIRATKVVYATMTDTDVTLYQTSSTYAQIEQKYGIKPLELATGHPAKGAAISVVSGYWKKIYSCNIDGFVPTLKEGEWTWKDSVRYTPQCKTIGGTSGSPVIDNATGKVAAINNTGNEDGEKCTVNNPCEVDENGNVTVHQGTNYAEETYGIPKCFGAGNKLDLSAAGCALPKPAATRR